VTRPVSARARLHDDRAGDPLDGLVNLFDVGIVLAVAFLLAALASIDLEPSALEENRAVPRTAPRDAVVIRPGQRTSELELLPGERTVGRGEAVGTVYRLEDGRTILVRPSRRSGGGG